MNQDKIGKFISSLRKEKKLTQLELAEKLGVTDRSISNWECGKNLPDVSLYKPLCDILGISVSELINGEKSIDKKISNDNAIISTIQKSQIERKKLKRVIFIIVIISIIIIISLLIIIKKYKDKNFQITISDLSILESQNKDLNSDLTIKNKKNNIYFYGIKSLQIRDKFNTYYDLKKVLSKKQITIDSLKKFLRNEYKLGKIQMQTKYNSEVQMYNSEKYTIILCNTLNGNKDIYIGNSNLEKYLQDSYCGFQPKKNCTFSEDYYVKKINNKRAYYDVTLIDKNNNTIVTKINKTWNLKENTYYTFIFSIDEIINNEINSIFEKAKLIEINDIGKKDNVNDLNECLSKLGGNI